ncbi:unnamed protein product, partial [Hapterophycus canaliculatus]
KTLGIGRYVVQSILGTGSTASTYRCTARGNGQADGEVAVKVLALRGMKSWKQLDLFQREAKVLKALRHPGIPRYR